MTTIDHARILDLTPHALPVYRQAFRHLHAALLPFEVLVNVKRLTHFLAQGLHETMGLTRTAENLNYSAMRLTMVWPARFPTIDVARPFSFHPEGLANRVYGGRMGNYLPGDGYKFMGRGLLQLTGRANYQKAGNICGLNLIDQPELAMHPDHVLTVAAAAWQMLGCNEWADTDDVKRVTKALNGGYHGLLDREQWLKLVRAAVGEPDVLQA